MRRSLVLTALASVCSTCDHSVDTDSGGTLGICTGD
jgi:hypothetical protein